MKVIILAAGYAKRLYPLTENQPKPLLPVGDRSILDHLIDKVRSLKGVSQIYIVTNAKFYSHFSDWLKKYPGLSCKIINDGTMDNETRLGAIGDIRYVLFKEKIEDDVLILAGDNLFDSGLAHFIDHFQRRGTSVGCFELGDLKKASSYGVLQLDSTGRVLKFLEKPAHPPSSLISTGIYGYTLQDLLKIESYLSEGGNPDAPGHFLEWLSKRKEVFGYIIEGRWFDIGDLESYRQADDIYHARISRGGI